MNMLGVETGIEAINHCACRAVPCMKAIPVSVSLVRLRESSVRECMVVRQAMPTSVM